MTIPKETDPAGAGKAPSFDSLPPTRVLSDTERATSELPTLEIPGYRVGPELGRGGMSVVLQAEHLALQRTVAIKVLLPGLEVTEVIVGRFHAEAEALARLSHPNIIQIFEIGQAGSTPYFVLEYCAGGNLHQRLRGRPAAVAEAALLIEQLARGIDAAHRAGIVHRDLKPANILFHLDGTPKITDFGLAKNLDTNVRRTRPDTMLGTPSYMAPEQAARKHADVGPAADIYALGVVLYEMLTGRPPFQAPTELDTLLQVIHDEPVSPRRLQTKIPRDLETICLKCLEKDPRRRFATAADLADDLARFRQGMAIVARPATSLARLGKLMRRHPLAATLSLAIIAILLVSAISIVLSLLQKSAALAREIDKAEKLRRALGNNRLLLADAAWLAKDVEAAQRYLDQIPPDLRRWEWSFYHKLYQGGLFAYSGPKAYVNCLALSGDDRYVAAGTGDARNLFIWEARSGKLLHRLPGHAPVFSALAFHPTLPLLASGGPDQLIKLWNPATGDLVRTLSGHRGAILGIVFHPDGKRLMSAASDGTLRFWDLTSGKQLPGLIETPRNIRFLAITPDGTTLVGAGEEGRDHLVYLWSTLSAPGKQAERILAGHSSAVTSVACSPDGAWIASGDKDGGIRLWQTKTGNPHFALQAHSRQVMSLAFTPDGSRLVSAADKFVSVRQIPSGKEELVLAGHRQVVSCVAVSADGRRIITGSLDSTVKTWDAYSQPPAIRYDLSPSPVTALAFSRDENLLACASGPHVRVVSLSGGRKVRSIPLEVKGVRTLLFSSTGRSLAYLTDAGAVHVKAGDNPLSTILSSAPIELFGWVGEELQYVLGNQRLGRWLPGAAPREHALPLFGRLGPTAFSDDGDFLAAEASGSIHLMKAFPPRSLFKVTPGATDDGPVRLLALNTDGTRLAVGFDRTIELWSLADGKRMFRYPESEPSKTKLELLTFASNGQRLLSKWADQTLRCWDAVNKDEPLPWLKTPPLVQVLAVSRTGKHVAFATSAGEVLCWDSFPADDADYRRFLTAPDAHWHRTAAARIVETRPPEEVNWFAACFHLRKLRELSPYDPLVNLRLAVAAAKLGDPNLVAESLVRAGLFPVASPTLRLTLGSF